MKLRFSVRKAVLWGAGALCLVWVVSAAAVVIWGKRDEARPASAIVVLGAAQYVGRPSPVLQARLDHGIALWKKGLAPRLILTGGTGVGDTISEAAVGRNYALEQGVPDSAILLENRGTTTSQSLEAVAGIVRQLPSSEVILVSDPFHMLRLSIEAERLGLEAYTSPTRTSPISRNKDATWRFIISESVKAPLTFLMNGSER